MSSWTELLLARADEADAEVAISLAMAASQRASSRAEMIAARHYAAHPRLAGRARGHAWTSAERAEGHDARAVEWRRRAAELRASATGAA